AYRNVHAAVRDRAHHRLGGARHGAARRRQDHPSGRQLHRPRERQVRAHRAPTVTATPMSSRDIKSAERPEPDPALLGLARYARNYTVRSQLACDTARYCLMDTLACGFQALRYPACRKLLGPVVPGAVMPGGARVPGTSFELEPVQAAFNIGAMIRWLDFND